jgi:ABC-2 type transport system permease protein
MPISDLDMVLSKAAWAFVLGPVIALAIGLAFGVVFWIVMLVGTAASGVPDAGAVLTQSHPFRLVAALLVALPVQMLWSLPAIGWLMLCSAWARRLPFLWATILPVLTFFMLWFTDIFPGVDPPVGKIGYTLIYRGLLSAVPGSWIPTISDQFRKVHGPEDIAQSFDVTVALNVLGHADVWIGAAIGIAMILAAIRLRRWRDEG